MINFYQEKGYQSNQSPNNFNYNKKADTSKRTKDIFYT
jgi:hypothetical protein